MTSARLIFARGEEETALTLRAEDLDVSAGRPPSPEGESSEERLDVSDFLQINSLHCNLCSANFGDADYRRNNFVMNSQGLRVVDPTGTNVAQASKLISWMVFISPEIDNRTDESTKTFDSAVVADDVTKPGLEVVRY